MLWFPFAKINLGLTVVNKRSDGFHNIESLLYPIKLYDILEIIEGEKDELILSGLSLDISRDENLVWKALLLLRKEFDFPFVKIHLHKQIPSGKGLGGGSSDATHTLCAINQLFQLKLSDTKLLDLASEIGSDCSFFIKSKPQYAKGRGEFMKDFELDLKPLKLLLIIPDFPILTKIAYSKIIPIKEQNTPFEILKKPIENWKMNLKNDFETLAFKDFPILFNIKEQLYRNGAIYASLSGSGSAMYALFFSETTFKLPDAYKSYWLNF